MKLKRYNEFSINESFGTSKEYSSFLKSKSINSDLFNDSLFDVKEFAKVTNARYLKDSKGHAFNTLVDDNEKYSILYTCQIQYNITSGRNDFNKIVDNLNTIKISIDEMIDRSESEGLKVKENLYLVDKLGDKVSHTFSISFTSSEINTKELKDAYNQYISKKDKEYLEGLEKLRGIYRKEGIDFDKYMDTNDDDEEYIQVGVFMGDDLYGVAFYNTKTKQFTIDENEISDSVSAYREDNR